MRRHNISVFFDGTEQNRSQQPPAKWSNVVLLHDAIPEVGTKELIQSRKYVDGVGTRPGEGFTGGAFGIDLDKRVEEAYDFIYQKVNNAKEDGEEPHIYLFGFSRGAYAARWLASLIQFAGVRKDEVSTRRLMQSHKKEDKKYIESLLKRDLLITDVPIDFLGVWDTVEASVDPSFDIVDLPQLIKSAFHALAIDEWRYTFNPTRFNASKRVQEVWFPGCHTDVGGGYIERAIANESLWWMISGAIDAGLEIDEDAVEHAIEERSSALKYHDELEGSKLWKRLNLAAGYIDKFFRTIKDGDVLHPSVQLYAAMAPSERPLIPDTCIAMKTKPHRHGITV